MGKREEAKGAAAKLDRLKTEEGKAEFVAGKEAEMQTYANTSVQVTTIGDGGKDVTKTMT
jgi:hypothetical protein